MSTDIAQPSVETIAAHLLAAKYFQIAAFTMLMYDHMITLPEEIERVWKAKLSGATLLFFINRYITPLQFIIVLDAFNDPIWTPAACSRFVVFEGACTVALVAVGELIMILRVYALYGCKKWVLVFLLILLTVQISISAVGLTFGFPVPLPPGLVGCILIGKSKMLPSLWLTPLVTDSCIFFLTLWRTRRYLKRSKSLPTIHILLRDGLMYFLVIFCVNLMNALIFFFLEEDLKAIGASFSQLVTATMISRLVINLRSSNRDGTIPGGGGGGVGGIGGGGIGDDRIGGGTNLSRGEFARYESSSSFMMKTIGNLGEDMDTFLDDGNHQLERDWPVQAVVRGGVGEVLSPPLQSYGHSQHQQQIQHQHYPHQQGRQYGEAQSLSYFPGRQPYQQQPYHEPHAAGGGSGTGSERSCDHSTEHDPRERRTTLSSNGSASLTSAATAAMATTTVTVTKSSGSSSSSSSNEDPPRPSSKGGLGGMFTQHGGMGMGPLFQSASSRTLSLPSIMHGGGGSRGSNNSGSGVSGPLEVGVEVEVVTVVDEVDAHAAHAQGGGGGGAASMSGCSGSGSGGRGGRTGGSACSMPMGMMCTEMGEAV